MVSGFNHIDLGTITFSSSVNIQLSESISEKLDNFIANDKPVVAEFSVMSEDSILKTTVVLSKNILGSITTYAGIIILGNPGCLVIGKSPISNWELSIIEFN